MRAVKIILETLFWMLAAGAVLFAVGVAVGLTVAPVLGYVAALAAMAILPLFVRTMKMIRRRRAAATLSYLEQAISLNLPLNRMLYAARQSEKGILAFRLASLHQLLNEGYPIGSAVESAVPEIEPREVALIEAAERLGRLPQTLQKLVREQRARAARISNAATFYRVYPFIMAVALALIVACVGIFVLPKFYSIYRDFGMKMPAITVATFDVAETFGPAAIALVAAAILLWIGMALWETFHPVRLTSHFTQGLRDRLLWHILLMHGTERDRGLADAFELIADALRAGTPADRALAEAAQLRVNLMLRHQLDRWATSVTQGVAMHDAARDAGMPALVIGLLATARGPDSAAQVFTFLARYYNTRFSRAAAFIEASFVPLLVFFFAAIVTCVALSLFVPMVKMIDNLN
jgi:type II secretory pathway component PulF